MLAVVLTSYGKLSWVIGGRRRVYIALGWRRDAHSGAYTPQLIVV